MALASVHDATGTATKAALTKQLWDSLLHERVQNKQAFKGLIGKDKAGESSLDMEVANKPIVEKTQLGKESGDQITMGLVNNLTTDPNTSGFTGVENAIDNEQGLGMYYLKVKIAHYMDAVGWKGRMSQQRSPFDLRKVAMDRLSSKLSKTIDDGIFYTLYSGYSPNVIRELGTSIAVPTVHPNRIVGKNQTAIANLSTGDVVDTELLELLRAYVIQSNLNPSNEGYLFFISPMGGKTLRADSAWTDANANAMPRSETNPIFEDTIGKWGGIRVIESNKLSTAKNYAVGGCTRGGSGTGADPYTLSWAADTPGVTATDAYMNVLIGANAVARGIGMESYMEQRKETAYGLNNAWAGGLIYGERRADWTADADNSTIVNQSSAIVYSYSPAVIATL